MAGPRSKIIAIQGLRAVAVLLVVAYHLGLPIGSGFIGVDVFFVISGFVITRMIFRQTDSSKRLDLKAFWAGRIRRLLPALAAMVVLTAVLASILTSPVGAQPATAMTGIAASAWVSNGMLAFLGSGYFARNAGDNPLMHTWSLAVEEQFYVLFPLMVVAILWFTRRYGGSASKRAARWITVVGLLSFALCVALTFVRLPLPVGGVLAFYSPFTRAWEFAAGALLALAVHRGWTGGKWTRASIPLGAATLVVGLVAIEAGQRFPGWIAVIPVAATVLLLIGAVQATPGVGVLNNRVVVYVGDISYSWYLFHWPLIVFATSNSGEDLPLATTVTVAVAGFALAAASYHWLEQPIRQRRRLARLNSPLLAALVILPALIASAGLLAGAQQGWGQQDIQKMQTQLDHGQWKYQKVCQSPVLLERRDLAPCQIEGDPDKRPLILVGDSNAGVYAELMVDVAAELDRTVVIATAPSCTLSELETVARDGSTWLNCKSFYRSTMRWLAREEPSTVVMASGLAAVDSDLFGLRRPDGTVAWTTETKEAAWRTALERSYAELAAMGHDVVQVELVPHFLEWRASQCTMLEMLRHGVASCGASDSRRTSDRLQAGALAAERDATSAAGVKEIKLRDALCPEDRCRTNDGNIWYYEDGAHLSFDGALSLKPEFTAALLH